MPELFNLSTGMDIFKELINIHLGKEFTNRKITYHNFATARFFGSAKNIHNPFKKNCCRVLDKEKYYLQSADIKNINFKFPKSEIITKSATNLDLFGDVICVNSSYKHSVDIAEQVVKQIEKDLGIELTK